MIQDGKTLLQKMLDALLPNRAAPVPGRVLKSHEGPGNTKYSVDVRVIKAGTLEDTDHVIKEVPISPIWATKKKRGVYAIPNEGQVLIIEFLCWNPAYPYVAGIWADEYEADEFGKDKFIITDGEGMKFIVDATDNSVTIDNGKGSIAKLEEDIITVNNKEFTAKIKKDKISFKNQSKSLFTVLDTALAHIIAMKTVGNPAQHVVAPDDITKLQKDKTDLGLLMEA
jgi:hypothetical protein